MYVYVVARVERVGPIKTTDHLKKKWQFFK